MPAVVYDRSNSARDAMPVTAQPPMTSLTTLDFLVTTDDPGPRPVDQGPVDQGPVDQGPIDQGPVDQGPVDQGAVDQ